MLGLDEALSLRAGCLKNYFVVHVAMRKFHLLVCVVLRILEVMSSAETPFVTELVFAILILNSNLLCLKSYFSLY